MVAGITASGAPKPYTDVLFTKAALEVALLTKHY